MEASANAWIAPCWLFAIACGGPPPGVAGAPGPLEVRAEPPGQLLEGAIDVELIASAPARIFYTLDGAPPNGPSGRAYEGPITLDRPALLTFVAVDERDIWSTPQVELYSEPRHLPASPAPRRALALDRDAIFFHVEHGVAPRERVRLRSIGADPVRVLGAAVVNHAGASAYFEEGIFTLETPVDAPVSLSPGEALELVLGYRPTDTLRGAALVILTDDERTPTGAVVVQLWGKVFGW